MEFQVLPPLSAEEFAALQAAIIDWGGVRDAVVLTPEGDVLDGHHRIAAWEALRAAGHALPPYPVVVRAGLADDAAKRTAARALNLARRHLTQEQKRLVIEAQIIDTPEPPDRQIALRLGVDNETVTAARKRLIARGAIADSAIARASDGRERPREYERPPRERPDAPEPTVADLMDWGLVEESAPPPEGPAAADFFRLALLFRISRFEPREVLDALGPDSAATYAASIHAFAAWMQRLDGATAERGPSALRLVERSAP